MQFKHVAKKIAPYALAAAVLFGATGCDKTPTHTYTPTPTPTYTQTITPTTTTPSLITYAQSPDGLARVDNYSSDLTQEELNGYLDKVYKLAVSSNTKLNAVVDDSYKWQGNNLVKTGEKKLMLTAEKDFYPGDGGLVRVESEQLDVNAFLSWENKIDDIYKFVSDALQPSKKPNLYVTISADGKRTNTTFFLTEDTLKDIRDSATSFYPWGDDEGQLKYEVALDFNCVLEYTDPYSDPFLAEFWGQRTSLRGMPNMGVKPNDNIYNHVDGNKVNQVGLGIDIYVALVRDGYNEQDFVWLAQKLEGSSSKWEQFKAAADAVAGKHLPTLDQLDDAVKTIRTYPK